MLTTDAQDILAKLIDRADDICYCFESNLDVANFQGLNLEKYIQEMEVEFHSLVSRADVYDILTEEVSKNLRLVNRDSTEFMYLKRLDSLFYSIDKLVELQKSDGFKKSVLKIGREYVENGDLDDRISFMLYIVSYNCHRIKSACLDSATLLRNSLFVFQNGAEFQNIIKFCNENYEAKGLSVQPNNAQEITEPVEKLQWNCSPAIAGYIISELIRARYIEPPKTNGELSYAKLARVCNQLFDIRSDGKPTTLDYLKKVVNPESNQLPDYKRAKLHLPDLDQLA